MILWGLLCCLGTWNIKQALESDLLIVPLHVETSAEAVPDLLPRVGSLSSCEGRDKDWTHKEFFQQELSICF